jgi:hypothetical protein
MPSDRWVLVIIERGDGEPRAGQQRGDPASQPASAQPGPSGPGPVGEPGRPFVVEPADPAAHGGRVAVQQLRYLGSQGRSGRLDGTGVQAQMAISAARR